MSGAVASDGSFRRLVLPGAGGGLYDAISSGLSTLGQKQMRATNSNRVGTLHDASDSSAIRACN